MGDAARRLGWDDYAAMPDDGVRREILDGEVVVMPSPNVRHQDLVLELAVSIRTCCPRATVGLLLAAPLAVVLSEHVVVEPDLIFVAKDGAAKIETQRVMGPPDILVEVLSPSNRRTDLLRKRRLYEAAGVTEYWIVDPEAESVTRLVRVGDAFVPEGPVFAEPGGAITTSLLPAFTLDVAALFAAAPEVEDESPANLDTANR